MSDDIEPRRATAKPTERVPLTSRGAHGTGAPRSAAAPSLAPAATGPEHWAVAAGSADVVRLDIPPDARRERVFEVFCGWVVANRAGHADAWHEMRVLVDGAQQWSRRVATHAGEDSLDLRLRCVVPVGRPLRLTAITALHHAQRVGLTITADEE